MSEGKTTAIFAGVAAVAFGLAMWSRPGVITDEQDILRDVVGKPIFDKFDDPDAAATFQIVKFDEDLGQLSRFEVAKDTSTGLWKLPSFEDYPADAAEQVQKATTPLISLPVLAVASPDRGDHSLYGVVNPDDEDLSVAESGVGMLVSVTGDDDQVLASLIVGKEVEQAENQRYVRVPTEDAVYVVELDTTPFTTEFDEWIKGELLEVRGFDITHIGLRDYAVLPLQGGGYGMSRNFDADLNYDAADSKWSLERLVTYEDGKPVDSELAEGESLQDTELNNLRNAVQDLQIVNVRRKPNGLAADLKADKSLVENKESLQSLYSQGFFPQETPAGFEIFATGGETIVATDDGVQYILRFGESLSTLANSEDEEDSGLQRYLLVSARLDETKFPVPDLEVQPESVEQMLQMQGGEQLGQDAGTASTAAPDQAAGAEDADDAEENSEVSESTTDAASSEDSSTAVESDPGEADADNADSQDTDSELTESDPAAGEDSDGDGEESSSDEGNASNSTDADADDASPETEEQQQADTSVEIEADATADSDGDDTTTTGQASESADEAEGTEPEPQAPEKTQEELEEELEAVRERINRDNQRKIDERNEQIDAARKKVQELNARFADWYYVVSDSVYKKLKISREQLISTGEEDSAANQPAAPGAIPGLPGGLQLPAGLGNP